METVTITKALNDSVIKNYGNVSMVLRMDLGSETCKIFSSQESDDLINFRIPYLFINWNFLSYNPMKPAKRLRNSKCSISQVEAMISKLQNQYKPLNIQTKKYLKKSQLLRMNQEILWIDKSIDFQEKIQDENIINSTLQKDKSALIHLYHIAERQGILPIELRENKLIIRDATFHVHDGKVYHNGKEIDQNINHNKLVKLL